MGGAKLLGEGSGGRLRPPVGPGQSPGRGARGAKPPGSSRVLNMYFFFTKCRFFFF